MATSNKTCEKCRVLTLLPTGMALAQISPFEATGMGLSCQAVNTALSKKPLVSAERFFIKEGEETRRVQMVSADARGFWIECPEGCPALKNRKAGHTQIFNYG